LRGCIHLHCCGWAIQPGTAQYWPNSSSDPDPDPDPASDHHPHDLAHSQPHGEPDTGAKYTSDTVLDQSVSTSKPKATSRIIYNSIADAITDPTDPNTFSECVADASADQAPHYRHLVQKGTDGGGCPSKPKWC
jgi:hypothetical protein